ncbi:hypothetical protein [Geothrix fermentans]|uniref:hypothetical protein n=1 Tax=Geothrix fermentans TaxID=44676 RepID=UPI000414DC49|nr:hypothetical protein [Geothrix fermentans]
MKALLLTALIVVLFFAVALTAIRREERRRDNRRRQEFPIQALDQRVRDRRRGGLLAYLGWVLRTLRATFAGRPPE